MSEDDLLKCVHCGFCLSSCPTYLETGSEVDSPRGRITLMRALQTGEISPDSPDLRRHLDLCLGCRACEPACPSGVPYGSLIEQARSEINLSRPKPQLAARGALLSTLTNASSLNLALKMANYAPSIASSAQRTAQGDASQEPSPLPRRKSTAQGSLPAVIPAKGKRRARVGMLVGCAMKSMFNDVNLDTASILAANGCEVLINQTQGCCGALHLHSGFADDARALARKLTDAFGSVDGLDAIVTNSAGCGSTMKEYAHLLADDSEYADRAAKLAEKCQDFSEYLDKLGLIAPLRSIDAVAAYHDACHLVHAQRIASAPRNLLMQIPGLTLVDLPESDICCGSAGIYSVTEPDMAKRLQSRKLANIAKTGASIVVASNPGCLSWIETGLADRSVEVLHPATLLRRALA